MQERGESKPNRLIELPQPYEEVVEEIQVDIATDRRAFIKEAMQNLKTENPQILFFLSTNAFAAQDSERSLTYSLAYYEIFSRTAKQQGAQLFEVSKGTLGSVLSVAGRDYEQAGLDPAAIEGKIKADEQIRQKLTEAEIEKSEELDKFWIGVMAYQAEALLSGEDLSVIKMTLEPTYIVRDLLYAQEEANRFNEKFPS